VPGGSSTNDGLPSGQVLLLLLLLLLLVRLSLTGSLPLLLLSCCSSPVSPALPCP
jgi:hypothetical protein